MSMDLNLEYREQFLSRVTGEILDYRASVRLWHISSTDAYDLLGKDNTETLENYKNYQRNRFPNPELLYRYSYQDHLDIAFGRKNAEECVPDSSYTEIEEHFREVDEFIKVYGVENVYFYVS